MYLQHLSGKSSGYCSKNFLPSHFRGFGKHFDQNNFATIKLVSQKPVFPRSMISDVKVFRLYPISAIIGGFIFDIILLDRVNLAWAINEALCFYTSVLTRFSH